MENGMRAPRRPCSRCGGRTADERSGAVLGPADVFYCERGAVGNADKQDTATGKNQFHNIRQHRQPVSTDRHGVGQNILHPDWNRRFKLLSAAGVLTSVTWEFCTT